MAGRATTDTCCLTLPLVLEKWQEDRLEKRFEIARQIYNSILSYEIKKLDRLEKQDDYQSIKQIIQELYKEESPESSKIKALYRQLNDLRRQAGFSEYAFKTDAKRFYKHFKDNIGSHVTVHGITPQVWNAFDRLFYGNGKAVHFKKRGEILSLRGYSDSKRSGGTEIVFRGTYIEWKGLNLPIKIDPDNAYEKEMLEKRIKYCRIVKRPGKKKKRWYVQLMLEGKPAIKLDKQTGLPKHPIGTGSVGIDIGPQTIAYVSKDEVRLQELAVQERSIEREKRIIQRKMDRSRRATNPDNYSEDGTIRRGIKLTWIKSKRYLENQHELAYLQHQHAEVRKQQHIELANHLLSLGDQFYVEDMNWPTLTHRAKKTEISEKTGRIKRKKRFGKSVGNKAPAMLISFLDQKLISRGFDGIIKVPTSIRASQYNHIMNDYEKKELHQRWNVMPDGKRIQRDLYSAFLLQHTMDSLDKFNLEAIQYDYESFLKLHEEEIKRLRSEPRTVASMGITRAVS